MPTSKYMKNRVLLTVALFTVMGCDRLKLDEQTKIQIKLPGSASSLSSKVENSTSSLNTARPAPTGMTGDRPINCYLIAASGPEPELQRNICQRKDGTTTFAPRKIGPWVGAAPAGSAIGIDVPSGKDRVIFVVGFHATTATACRDFKANGFPLDSEMSYPYIVGEAGNLELKPGEVKDLPLNVSFNEANRFDGCDGPDFPDDHNGSGSAPTKIEITKEWFPTGKFVADSCQSVDLVLKDNEGRHAVFPVAIEVTPQITISAAAQSVYSNYQDCQASVNPMSKVTIPPFTDRMQVVFRTPYDPQAVNIALNSIIAPNGLTIVGAGAYQSFASSSNTFDLVGPWSVLPDVCYPFNLNLRQMSGSPGSNYSGMTVNVSGAAGVSLYSTLATCQTSTTPSTSFVFPSYTASLPIYVKMSSALSADVALTFTDAASTYVAATQFVRKGYGTNVPAGVEIRGFNQLGSINYCADQPHEVFLVNSYHTPVVPTAATNVNVSGNLLGLYANPGDCSYPQNPINNVSIPAGGYSAQFYIRATAFGNGDIAATVTGFPTNYYPIKIDGPSSWNLSRLDASAPVANNTCIPLKAKLMNFSGTDAYNSYRPFTPNVSGIPGPSTYNFYSDSGCTSQASYLETPPSGIAERIFYLKVNNLAGADLTFSVNVTSGDASPSQTIPITVQY